MTTNNLKSASRHLKNCDMVKIVLFLFKLQRWSRGHKTRGQEHKKIRGQGQPFRGPTLSRPRTGWNARGQGPRIQPQVFSKKKVIKKSFPGDFQFIGAAKYCDWGGS